MKKIIVKLFTLAVLTACNADYIVDNPEFTVSGPLTVKAGQEVVFNLTGNPNIITFYSGENGNSYEYANQDRIGALDVQMTFMTTTSSGTQGAPNPARLPLYYSTDFSGNYTVEDVNKATWVEITDRFTMPDDTGMSSVPSGAASITDIFPENGEPVYLMYSYHLEKYDAVKLNGRTQWQIKDLTISGVADGGSQKLYDIKSSNWQFVYGPGTENNLEQFPELPGSSARILFRFDFRPASDMQLWAVSGPLVRPENSNLGPDRGVGIKAFADPTLRSYKYTYTTPGEYTATFVGANVNASGREETIQNINIKVEEAEHVSEQALDIIPAALECNAGEPVIFEFSGDAETLDFWSGEPGHDYAYVDGGQPELAQMHMQFRSCMMSGNQVDNLRVKASTDFDGTMTEEGILKATWMDITDRYTLPTEIAGAGNPHENATNFAKYVRSGNALVTDCYNTSDNVYFAMFWEIEKYESDNGRTVTWICDWKISESYTNGESQLAFNLDDSTDDEKVVEIIEGSSFSAETVDTNHPGWYKSKFTSDIVYHFRFFSSFKPESERRAYAVTKRPVARGKKAVGADTPYAIKTTMQNNMPSTWSYTFAEPGTYNVVFVIGSVSEDGNKIEETKEFTITVK